jgi:hypothetical protein
VLNKSDLTGLPTGVERDPCGTITAVRVSALTGAGIDGIKTALAERFALANAAVSTQPSPGPVGTTYRP